MYILVLPLLLLGLWLLAIFIQGLRNPLSHVPGPWYSKWTSMVLMYHWLRGRRASYVNCLHETHGKVVRISPSEVDFASISGAKRVHAFVRPFPKARMYDTFRSANGAVNVFGTRDVDVHARHRRLLSSAISEASLKNVEHIVHQRAELAVEKIGLETKQGGAADVMKWWLYFSTDVIGELTFGDSFRMLEQGKVRTISIYWNTLWPSSGMSLIHRKNQYVHDLQNLAQRVRIRIAFPNIIKLASYIPLPLFTEAYASVQRMGSYAEQSIHRYENIIAAQPNNPKPTLFTKLFNVNEETMPKANIVANAQAYITAGSDTTAHTLTYLVWAVCREPSIRARLAKEVADLPDRYQDEDLKALPFLNQVIQETLRLYAAAPAHLPREVPPAGSEIDGYWMPGGTDVQTQAYSMHRDPIVYPAPEQFNPSRWEAPSKDMKDAWMPFGGGARVCIGLHLALMELRIATTKLFRMHPNARVSTLRGFCDDDMEQVIYFLMYPKNKRCLIQAS
ncbi:cytochrome protein [Ophiobolus disseminans]|uniref:Cytochrome protein n=1 Tax=Ophiobolus disseminans TaxID=1469910 RepID=A0A6A6ZL78_9PLEO|nr:cytochrome protein [Ophiobolus disseminans]